MTTKHVGMGPRAAIAAMTCTCALLLAACGGSSNKQSSATVPVAPTNSTPSTTTPTQTTGTQTSTTQTSTNAGAPPPCVTSDFALRYLGQAGATGHGELGFALRNVTPYQCRTFGYPGVLFLDKAGNALPTKPTHTTVDFFGKTSETELVVLPGASVSFRLGVNHGAGSTAGCTTAYGLQVIAPDDTHTTHTSIPQGAFECGGQVTVSPLQASTLAFEH
ncbi:MAG TPA: DUF4232 domain-containing protein [Solirubrobacteraceae bacterium]|nr:DUF4232 domain-containing protein [Solirubrobacteraceae bacterium]